MKVLFAVNNENISETIIKKYQQDYKQIISSKNVYYFNAIIKELQRDKSYDRIIISEDLEPFSNNNVDTIDKFIFEKMDNISDEATNLSGNNIPIILICTDRRTKTDEILAKLFGIGVYDALIGKDRSITNVCGLLNKPRTKKDAKLYYKIDYSGDIAYPTDATENTVSEVEIQNILNFYKKLGKNEEKYIESFNHIAEQYTDTQLRLIAKFLPLNVKAVLESSCPKYQEVVSFTAGSNTKYKPNKQPKIKDNYTNTPRIQKEDKENAMELEFVEKNLNQNKITEPVIIPSAMKTSNIKRVENINNLEKNVEDINDSSTEDEEIIVQPKKRGRGRPRKTVIPETETTVEVVEPKKRGRGRPRKVKTEENENIQKQLPVDSFQENSKPMNLFELADEEESNTKPNNARTSYADMVLPGLDEEEEETTNQDELELSNLAMQNSFNEDLKNDVETARINQKAQNTISNYSNSTGKNQGKYQLTDVDLSPLLSSEKKIVSFVGTSKNGTSFIVNSLAEILSKRGIKTALLDLTQNKNSYYIYTENEENLRRIAYETIDNLERGEARGIQVNNNLTVFTSLPGEDCNNYAKILETLLREYSLILLDCDFETNYGYFKESNEIYLVQTMDILTIQPLTVFLNDLKAKNILKPERIRVVLNKMIRVKSLNDKVIIGGMSKYKDPEMSIMTDLFNMDTVPYCDVPFDESAYSKYLEGLVNCKITTSGYSRGIMDVLNKLANMVYTIGGKTKKLPTNYGSYNNYSSNNNFSNSMNDTLNKMKNTY